MNRLVLLVATAAIVLIAPTAAHAAPPNATTVNAAVSNGVLTYTSGPGTVDNLTITQSLGGVTIAEPTSPEAVPVGAGCGVISATSAYCSGATTATVQTLDLDDTILNWSWLSATLDAGDGADTITGGVAVETIRGGAGNDTIKAGKGADMVDAGPGDDKVDVQDGVIDTVDCGAGSDTIVADPDDVLTNCDVPAAAGTIATGGPLGGGETASPNDQSTDSPISAPKLLAAATLVGPVIAAVSDGAEVAVGKKGTAQFMLGCSAEESGACVGTIFIDPVTTKKAKKSKKAKQSVAAFMARRGRYGSSPFKVKPGSEDKVDVKLSGIALKALGKKKSRKARAARRGRRVRAVVTIAPRKARAQRVTIVLKG